MIDVVKVLVVDSDTKKILLIKRSSSDTHGEMWETPGGGIDPSDKKDETDIGADIAAKREVLEESGLTLTSTKEDSFVVLQDDETNESFNVYLRYGEIKSPVVDLSENSDHTEYVWVDRTEIESFIASGNKIDSWTLNQFKLSKFYKYI